MFFIFLKKMFHFMLVKYDFVSFFSSTASEVCALPLSALKIEYAFISEISDSGISPLNFLLEISEWAFSMICLLSNVSLKNMPPCHNSIEYYFTRYCYNNIFLYSFQ